MNNEQLKQFVTTEFPKMAGWCDETKGCIMGDLILHQGYTAIADIGVFEGKSTLAMAKACQLRGAGVVYGVDSWNRDDCTVDAEIQHEDWWKNLDIEKHREGFYRHLDRTQLADWVKIHRTTSYKAAHEIPDGLDMVHIDANHSEWSSTFDVCLWLPKIKVGGHLIMDDTNWATTQTAVRFAKKFCDFIVEHSLPESVFSIFRRTK